MPRLKVVRRHPWWTAAFGAIFVGCAAFVLLYFAPQDLFIQTRVDEPVPAPIAVTTPIDIARVTQPAPSSAAQPAVVVLRRGTFHSGEHATSGTAKLITIADGRRYVRLESLSTSNGPAVHVWLSAAPARSSDRTVEDAAHVDLGGLKANHGNQNYDVPSTVALSRYRSVVIWCERFDVVFGSASLT